VLGTGAAGPERVRSEVPERGRSEVPVVGMVGAGQLARMSLAAATALGVRLRLLAADADDAAAQVAADVSVGAPADRAALTGFAAGCDVLTFDHELVDLEVLAELEAAGQVIRPRPAALALAVDKRHQRAVLGASGLPLPASAEVATEADVAAFAAVHGWPVVVKAATGGYDGRGVWVLDDQGPLPAGVRGRALLAEEHVDIERELAVLVARRPGGQTSAWPLVETVQSGGICVELLAPARVEPAVAEAAVAIGLAVAEAAGVAGVLAVELFLTGSGALVVNELATRPHNSGHWTIEGARTSQFANHLRAVLDLPLGDPGLAAPAAATVNVLGGAPAQASPGAAGPDPRDLARLAAALAVPGVAVHLYGKRPRPGRKLGHVTALGPDPDGALALARRAAAMLTGGVDR
jgi:5-(carboxyamino)imidazole ribonucleotide synthase